MHQKLRTFERADGRRRAWISKRPDGHFSFGGEVLYDPYDDGVRVSKVEDMVWIPMHPGGGMYASEEIAERELYAQEKWMRDL